MMEDQQRYRDALAQYLVSEKDTRPYADTYHRGFSVPGGVSGYNNAPVTSNSDYRYMIPSIAGGSAWGFLHDIMQGKSVTDQEIKDAASDAAGAAMTGSLAMTRPSGSIGSGGRRAAPNEAPTVTTQRMGGVEDWSSKMGRGYVDAERMLPSTDVSIMSSYNGGQSGAGVPMYRALIDAANRNGLSVTSDEMVSQSAQHVYDALARRGHRVTRHPDAVNADGTWMAPQGQSVFDVGPSPWATYANAPTSAASPLVNYLLQYYDERNR